MAKKRQADLFGDDQTVREMSEFEAMLNSAPGSQRQFRPGDRFRGEILAVTDKEAFISSGTATDAVMPFTATEKNPAPKAGEFVDVVVVRVRSGEILVKPLNALGVGLETESLEDAFDMEIPVEGTVLEAIKGGFRVKVQGQKGFCPISQMDWRVTNADDYIGKKFDFVITKFVAGRDLVVSRRRLLEAERALAEGEFLEQAKIDDIFSGSISRIEKFGAFVRLESGVEGLIPAQELSWSRVVRPQDVVQVGQTVQVKLIRKQEDDGRLKLSFSLKQGGAIDDPWSGIESRFPVGQQFTGVVEHREPFGLFVNIAPGVTGLLPRSKWRDSLDASQYETRRRGDQLKVQIENIDIDNRKLSFALPGQETDDSWKNFASSKSGFGTFGDLKTAWQNSAAQGVKKPKP